MTVSVLFVFFTVLWAVLQYVIVVFPGHTQLLKNSQGYKVQYSPFIMLCLGYHRNRQCYKCQNQVTKGQFKTKLQENDHFMVIFL